MNGITEKQFKKLSATEKKKYPFATAIGNNREVMETYYFKSEKDQLQADKESGLVVGENWTEAERLKKRDARFERPYDILKNMGSLFGNMDWREKTFQREKDARKYVDVLHKQGNTRAYALLEGRTRTWIVIY